MQQKFPKGSEEAQMMIDFVNLVQNHYIVEDTDEYVDNFLKDMYAYADKYKNINERLSQHMALAMLNYIEGK